MSVLELPEKKISGLSGIVYRDGYLICGCEAFFFSLFWTSGTLSDGGILCEILSMKSDDWQNAKE